MTCCSDSCLMCRMFDHVQLCLLTQVYVHVAPKRYAIGIYRSCET